MFKKTLLFTVLIISLCCLKAETFPKPSGYVNDFTNTLSVEQKTLLNDLSADLEKKTGIELVSVIVKNLDGDAIDDYANKLFAKWGIGKKDKNNGILFITALDDRRTRIEVGYGLEGTITDGKAGEILDQYVIPYFRVGNITKGIVIGHIAIAQILAKANGVSLSGAPVISSQNQEIGQTR